MNVRRLVVVGAAIVRDGRLLAAQRAAPPRLAGLWELPGGKVDPGESDTEALVREVAEELGATVVLGERVGPDLPLGGTAVFRAWVARLVDGAEPSAHEHRALRWLAADELGSVPWLPADLPLLPALTELLAATLDDRDETPPEGGAGRLSRRTPSA